MRFDFRKSLVLWGMLAAALTAALLSSCMSESAPKVNESDMNSPDVVMLFTGGTHGMLEVCNCAGPMAGSLSRRSGLIAAYRRKFPDAIVLDTGDVFWVSPENPRNNYILRAYAAAGYDAVVLGDQEWSVEPARLEKLLKSPDKRQRPTYLSTTVSLKKSHGRELPVTDVIKRDFNGARVAVLSDLRAEAMYFLPDDLRDKLAFTPFRQLAEKVKSLKQQGYVVIVVSHMPSEHTEKLAGQCRPDLIIRGHTMVTDDNIQRCDGVPFVEVGGHEVVGVLKMDISGGEIGDIEFYTEAVDRRWPADEKLIDIYQAYAREAMRRTLDYERKEGLDYVASSRCGQCHGPQYEAWQKTRHAHAYRTLRRENRHIDPECVTCHTTGFHTAGGFYTYERTPKLAGVGCQECHRFNVDEHLAEGYETAEINKDVCTTCHTRVTDPHFNYQRRLKNIHCPRMEQTPPTTMP